MSLQEREERKEKLRFKRETRISELFLEGFGAFIATAQLKKKEEIL